MYMYNYVVSLTLSLSVCLCVCLFYSFAATKNELHEFSPTKEPLLSMLEGEIQTMYMCKPGEGLSVLADSKTSPPVLALVSLCVLLAGRLRSVKHGGVSERGGGVIVVCCPVQPLREPWCSWTPGSCHGGWTSLTARQIGRYR